MENILFSTTVPYDIIDYLKWVPANRTWKPKAEENFAVFPNVDNGFRMTLQFHWGEVGVDYAEIRDFAGTSSTVKDFSPIPQGTFDSDYAFSWTTSTPDSSRSELRTFRLYDLSQLLTAELFLPKHSENWKHDLQARPSFYSIIRRHNPLIDQLVANPNRRISCFDLFGSMEKLLEFTPTPDNHFKIAFTW